MRVRRFASCAALLVLAGVLAGCTAGPVDPQPTPTPTPTPSAPVTQAAPPPTEEPDAVVERVGSYPVQTPVDSGPREYANGAVELDAAGAPVAYIVASGDIVDFVAERLGLDGNYLVALNQVRRGWTGMLYAGDVLNLDPHRITSVGSINGEVLDEPAPDPLPPQA